MSITVHITERDNAEGSTFSTDFIKFREARVEYGFSPKLVKKAASAKGVLRFYGRNLFIWSPWPMFDLNSVPLAIRGSCKVLRQLNSHLPVHSDLT